MKGIIKAFLMTIFVVTLVDLYWIFIEYWWHYFFLIGFVFIGYIFNGYYKMKETTADNKG